MDDFTVGDLRRHLAGLSDDTKLTFHAGLTFHRIKRWTDDEYVLEFGEYEADLSPAFRTKHPNIIAAFVRPTYTGEPVSVEAVPQL